MWISVAFILALAVSGVNSNGFCRGRRCPPGWEKFEMQCFKFFSDLKPWAEAEKKCLELGGNLASVHDPHTSGFLKTFLRKCASGMPRTWIGAHDAVKNNVWFWSDGSKFDYSDWLTGEPNENGGNENCVELAYGAEQRWNDLDCATPLNFICFLFLLVNLVCPSPERLWFLD